MKELILQILKEQLEGGVDKPLSEKEIRLFKYLNKHKTEYPTQSKLLEFIKTMMPFVGRPATDGRTSIPQSVPIQKLGPDLY